MGSLKALQFPRITRSIWLCACALLLSASAAAAQDPPAPDVQAPAHVSLVDGVALLERDGQPDDAPANMPLLAGDRLRTRTGRVEVLFADGSTLHLDHHTAIDLQSDELVRLIEGRIRISIPGPSREVAYRVDSPFGWARILEPGDYRLALLNGPGGRELEVAVLRGSAELANEDGRTALRAGERAFARAQAAPSYAYVVNSAAWDAFDRWSESLREERISASAQYLPDEVRPYSASLERHGYWRDEPTYGRVWYPRVAGDWRPYYRGRWVLLRPYGWTWVAHDPWGWPTHHYGRWGYSTAGWFWIPGRTWGAAWVHWAYAPGYVSWCPLGWNNRPVFQININIGRRYDPWRAWTVIPRRHFGVGYVHRAVVRSASLDHRAFTARDRAPEITGYAVPRASAPIRVAGVRDGRRATPLYTNLPGDRARTTSDGPRIRMGDPASRTATGVARPRAERDDLTRSAPRARPSADPARPSSTAARPPTAGSRPSPGRARPSAGADRPSLERARPPAQGARPAAPGARPSLRTPQPSEGAAPRAIPRDRAVPTTPAVRSERPNSAPRRDASAPSASPSRSVPRASPRGAQPQPGPPAAPPRYQRPGDRPSFGGAPQVRERGPAVPNRAVPRMERPAPSVERSRPSGIGRPGPSRPSAGSTESRPPAAAGPPQGESSAGARPAAPRPGARPRPGGGGGGGR